MPQPPQVLQVDLCVALAGSNRSVRTQPVRRLWRSHSLTLISIDVKFHFTQFSLSTPLQWLLLAGQPPLCSLSTAPATCW